MIEQTGAMIQTGLVAFFVELHIKLTDVSARRISY